MSDPRACCCDGGCPNAGDPLCGQMTLSTALISTGRIFQLCSPDGGGSFETVSYYVDSLILPIINIDVSAPPVVAGEPQYRDFFGCRLGQATAREVVEGGATTELNWPFEVNWRLSLACQSGVWYVLSASVDTPTPYPFGDGLSITERSVFFFSHTDPDNTFEDLTHPAPFTNCPKLGVDSVPNLLPGTIDTASDCGTMSWQPMGVGGAMTFSFSAASDCATDKCVSGVIDCPRCDDPEITHPVDLADIPIWANSFRVGVHRYSTAGVLGVNSALGVDEWLVDGCPPDATGPLKGVRCRNSGIALEAPAEVAYEADPGIGAGNGSLTYTFAIRYPSPDSTCDEVVCVFLIRYRPTLEPASPDVPVVDHQAGTPCGLSDTVACYRDSCPPNVAIRPIDPCSLADPYRPSWCDSPDSMETASEGNTPSTLMIAAQERHLAGPLARQRRAANCRNCGDPGVEGLA